jgi:hypothetical protein
MNDRIRELLIQAIYDVDYIRNDEQLDKDLSEMFIPDCFAERFAELIILECADVASDDWQTAGRAIKKHFGVE